MPKLEGKGIVVTGAVGGIGATTTDLMVEEGANVIVADINKAGADAKAEEIRGAAGITHFVPSRP